MIILADTPIWLTPVGWLVTFILGIGTTLISQHITKKRKVISWSILSESELFSQAVAESTSLPVKVVVGDSENKSLSAVNLRVGNTGNEVVSNVSIPIRFNPGATVLKHQIENDIGEYGKHISQKIEGSSLILNLSFINPRQIIDLEVLLGEYQQGSVLAELAAPGVELRRQEAGRWDFSASTGIFKSVALGIAGVRYDPTVPPLTEIAETLRSVNKKLEQK